MDKSQEGNIYRRVFTAVVNTHWPIVFQFHLHHRLEDTIFHSFRFVRGAHFVVEVVVDLAGNLGLGCIVEIGFIAFLHLAIEGELGD